MGAARLDPRQGPLAEAGPPPRPRSFQALGISLFVVWIAIVYQALFAEIQDGYTYAALGSFGAVFGLGLFFPALGRRFTAGLLAPRRWIFLALTSTIASLTTVALVLGPMRGQPASLDGSVYTFQARALTHLSYGFPIPFPKLVFGLRFLFEGADGHMHGVFPIGYPLFLAPFLAIGLPVLAYIASATLLVLVTYALSLALTKNELAARLASLLFLPSFGRVIETAEPASHALVGILASLILLFTLRLPDAKRPLLLALALGASAGWAFATRLLDGIVLGFVFGPLLLFWALRGHIRRAAIPCIVLGALPFVALLLGQQYTATGSPFRPNVTEYAVRSDWPPTCLRLGLGEDIGCGIEHPFERESFGPDGYQIDDAFRLIRERAEVLGPDLFGSSWVLLLAFLPFFFAKRGDDEPPLELRSQRLGASLSALFLVALTLTYGLYYYGNHPIWGARHLFPAAPFVFALLVRGIDDVSQTRRESRDTLALRGSLGLALLVAVSVAAVPIWKGRVARLRSDQKDRVDLRALVKDERVERGIVTTMDTLGVLAGWDSFVDKEDRFLALDSSFGVHDLRAHHPTLPVFEAHPPARLVPVTPPSPEPKTFVIEFERAWPSFQRPKGLGAGQIFNEGSLGNPALMVVEAAPKATLTIPFWIAESGRYSVRLVSIQGPDHGDYKLTLDGQVLPLHRGYAATKKRVISPPSIPLELEAGRHELVAECLGKQAASEGYRAIFDMLIGTEAP